MLGKLRASFHTAALRQYASTAKAPKISTTKVVSSKTVPQFVVGSKNGFLPRQDPLEKLPPKYKALEELLQAMPLYNNVKGKKGLLLKGKFGEASAKIPEYDVSALKDTRLIAALFRDYTFWASAYLLEPCDIMYRSKEEFGFGRDRLPRNIAVPLVKLAEKIQAKPFMEYALSYALYNWKRIDPKGPIEFKNMQLIRSFSGLKSETGFILVHVAMVAHSANLVNACFRLLDAVKMGDRPAFNKALDDYRLVMSKINEEMESMWARSKHADYQKFRTFIMGVKNQPMFPNGVIYEGVSTEPMSFRGESGANDSIIPTGDNLFELYDRMPKNPLTEILKDFRQYRPIGHQLFLTHIYNRAKELGVRKFALGDSLSSVKYLENLDEIRDFRWRHWNFTKEYILKYYRHPVATGGSPIVTWLPNQLKAVLDSMSQVIASIKRDDLPAKSKRSLDAIKERVEAQRRVLVKEVNEIKKKYPDQDL